MNDEYGLWIWDAAGTLRFAIHGRYLRFHSKYTRTVINNPNWSFSIPIPGASNDGTWSAHIRMGNASFASWYVFSENLLTVYVSSQGVSATMYIVILRG